MSPLRSTTQSAEFTVSTSMGPGASSTFSIASVELGVPSEETRVACVVARHPTTPKTLSATVKTTSTNRSFRFMPRKVHHAMVDENCLNSHEAMQ